MSQCWPFRRDIELLAAMLKLRKLKQDADKKKAAEVEAEKKGIAVSGSTSAGELVLQKEACAPWLPCYRTAFSLA